jgi:hypothetical protein
MMDIGSVTFLHLINIYIIVDELKDNETLIMYGIIAQHMSVNLAFIAYLDLIESGK